MKTHFTVILIIAFLGISQLSLAQKDSNQIVKIAVFTPAYLDSAFTDEPLPIYQLSKTGIPKFIIPGLDFYHGVMFAIDSLNQEKAKLAVSIYDTKNKHQSLKSLINSGVLDGIHLMIAAFNNKSEIKVLADFCLAKNIPLINASFPSDGGLVENPFYAMVNPTLPTHLAGIIKQLKKDIQSQPILVLRKKGAAEDLIQNTLLGYNKEINGITLKLQPILLSDSFTIKQITQHLDSTKENIIIGASMQESFVKYFLNTLGNQSKYKTIIYGMPTWSNEKAIGKKMEILYSTPYQYKSNPILANHLLNKYKKLFSGRASDMVFKGFETMYHFSKLLLKHQNNLINHLSDSDFTLFNQYQFEPVKIKKEEAIQLPDYLENKQLYFLKIKN